jgi:HD superfamily phosphodiesterase
MSVSKLTSIINQSFHCVSRMSSVYNIDESHAVKHSMNVYHNANEIYKSELPQNKFLENQQTIIFASAILHDMCDKKYIDPENGLRVIHSYMNKYITDEDFETITKIITSMSYSKVKQNGYANMGEYQLAYHIVREADLLAAYDIDRCIMYGMNIDKMAYSVALNRAIGLFDARVLTYRSDNLFVTQYAKDKSAKLHQEAVENMKLLNLLDGGK